MDFDVTTHPGVNNPITVKVSPNPANNDFKKHGTEDGLPEGGAKVIRLLIDDAPGGTGDNPIEFDFTNRLQHVPAGGQNTKFVVYHKDDQDRSNRRGESVVVIANDDGGAGQ